MSEFCLDCVNKHFMDNGNELLIKDVVTEVDLCEGCGQIKPCVIKVRRMSRYKLYSGTRQKRFIMFLIKTIKKTTCKNKEIVLQ